MLENQRMIKYLDKVSKAYYQGNSIITDEEFDYLAELFNYNKVGAALGKIKHYKRLYSLRKYYKGDKNIPSSVGYIKTPKLDGSAISILYVDGKLESAATRGNGIIGENITHLFQGSSKVPQTIEYKGLLQAVGELVAPSYIKNSRNYAAGSTGLKSAEEFSYKEVEFITYGVTMPIYSTYTEDLTFLKSLGFNTVIVGEVLKETYPTDGEVFRLDNNSKYIELGFTDKHPRGAYAVKDASNFETAQTVLNEVIWQVGKSGKVTPVAIFDTIVLEDASINRATLHNAGFIEEMGLELGDTIIVTRSGGIIPKVLGVAA